MMALLAVLLSAEAAARSVSSSALPLSWIFPDGEPWGVQCVSPGHVPGLCRAYAHLLVAATPSDPAAALVGGATYAVDGAAAVAGPPAVFETHVIPPSNASQVFTVDFDALVPPGGAVPSSVCVAPWVATADGAASGSLPPFCMQL